MGREDRQLYSLDSLLMYLLTLFGEAPVIIIRFLATVLFLGFLSLAKGHPESIMWGYLPLIPTGWSAIALTNSAGTGWWWKQRMGGREPSSRELIAYQDAIELLQGYATGRLPLPHDWFVIDTQQPDAAVCGETLMLSRGLFETDQLPAVIAHELGHLATPDGRLTAAVNRLLLWTPSTEPHDEPLPMLAALLRWTISKALAPFKGGLGLYATAPLWGRYWRGREYRADAYAASLGQGDELADFLELHALIHDHPVPLIWLTEHTHPPTELRVDRLRNHTPALPARVQQPARHLPAA
jgi:Zn-dependent protease with chaperone function